jgi:biopolymer transport protein ExbD
MPKQAFIKSDARAPWGKIIEVVDRLAVAGINELGFLVSPQ